MMFSVPFINSKDDWALAQEMYPGCPVYRTTLALLTELGLNSNIQSGFWADTEVDALHNWPKSQNETYNTYFENIPGAAEIGNPGSLAKPSKTAVMDFTNSLLNKVIETAPNIGWLSVPQLPHVNGTERNKLNRALAEAAQQWKSKNSFKGKFILPALFTHQDQLNNKTQRNAKVALVTSCFDISGSEGLWVVDSSLHDQEGKSTFPKRFKGIIGLHEELNKKLPPRTLTFAGPYWGLGTVLWARGLVQYASIGVGRGYQYYIPGGVLPKSSSVRIALSPLRRQAIWSPDLRIWIETTLKKIPKGDSTFEQFSNALKQFSLLREKKQARRQITAFYREWLQKFEDIPQQGRPLALYQDFSSAYVLGKTLSNLPDKVKSPSKIAEQFMMVSL